VIRWSSLRAALVLACKAGRARGPMERAEIEEAVSVAVRKEISGLLLSFGIEDDDKKELRADFLHLRRWRKGVECRATPRISQLSCQVSGSWQWMRAGKGH
jgi:hypothetical protein